MTIAELIVRNSLLKSISETMTNAEVVNETIVTPPFQWGAGGSPQGRWNLSEWS